MLKLFAGIFATAAVAAVLAGPSPAKAETLYPWCAEYAESVGGGTNCGFSTWEQCRATISGLGGMCYGNPAYPAAAPQPKRRSDRR